MGPRLDIVIPTCNRPTMLPRAIDSALAQSREDGAAVPVRAIVADDGDAAATAALLAARYPAHLADGRIAHLRTGAADAWSNWRAGALAADAPFVAWLQDDDRVSRHYAARILDGFDAAERLGAAPSVWMARLDCSAPCGRFGLHYLHNGPLVPMPTLLGEREACHWTDGSPIAASAYFTSWSLSPALAYRNGPAFRAAIRRMPAGADMFVERIIPAELATAGGMITDPEVVGYWIRHDDNLSVKQYDDQPRQTAILVAHLDGLLDRIGGWRGPFAAWLRVQAPGAVLGWLGQLDVTEREGGESRHGATLRRLMIESLDGRVRAAPPPAPEPVRPRWRRALDAARRLAGRRR